MKSLDCGHLHRADHRDWSRRAQGGIHGTESHGKIGALVIFRLPDNGKRGESQQGSHYESQ